MPRVTFFGPQASDHNLRHTIYRGTRAMGANYYGTLSFPTSFAGSPTVMLTPMGGSTSTGRTVQLGVRTIFSGSFTWRGSPNHGTISWMAYGPTIGSSGY